MVAWWLSGHWIWDQEVASSTPGGCATKKTTPGKLFTPTCLCRCTWSSGWCRLVTFMLRFDSHCGSFANNLEQVDNLLCAQVNSASYPQRDRKWEVAYMLRGEGLVWLIGAVVHLLAANHGSNHSMMRAMEGRIVHCGITSSCQSAATSEMVKWMLVFKHTKLNINKSYFFVIFFKFHYLLSVFISICKIVTSVNTNPDRHSTESLQKQPKLESLSSVMYCRKIKQV